MLSIYDSSLKILIIDNNVQDLSKVVDILTSSTLADFDIMTTSSIDETKHLLQEVSFDAIVSELYFPDSQGIDTLEFLRSFHDTMPILFLTNSESAELALETVKRGAQDFINKKHLFTFELDRAILYAIERASVLRQLLDAREHISMLQGLIPICTSCKKIRDDNGYWAKIEQYFSEHIDAHFTHSLCPGCAEDFYKSEVLEDNRSKQSITDAVPLHQ